jgi:hypothetical protein
VFTEDDNFAGVDLDDCRDPETGAVAPWGQELVDLLDSYAEISPSSTGIKVFLRGRKPGEKCRKKYKTGEIEIYDKERFFALTGHRVDGTPSTVNERQEQLRQVYRMVFGEQAAGSATAPPNGLPSAPAGHRDGRTGPGSRPSVMRMEPTLVGSDLSDEQLLAKIRSSRQGPKFSSLYDQGDISQYHNDDSAADQALINILIWWCGPNAERVDGLFRGSRLCRDKWVNRADYRSVTITKAIAICAGRYWSSAGPDDPDEPAPTLPSGQAPGNGEQAQGVPSAQKRVRTIEPYVPFPTEALPTPLREFVEHGSAAMGCDAAYFALPVLAVVASCIGNARVIVLKLGWYEPLVLWVCVVGESGTLKTPALQKVVEALYRWQGDAIRTYETGLEQWKKDIEEWKKDMEEWKQRNPPKPNNTATQPASGPADPPPAEPVRPVLRRWLVSDTTVEKLELLLEQSPRGLLLVRDELAGWADFQRYRNKGSDLPFWLEVFRANPWIRDRVGGKPGDRTTIFIPHAAVSICGGITPGALRNVLSAEYLEHGLGARLLLAMPPRRDKHWSEACIPDDVKNCYEELLSKLIALEGDQAEVNLSPEAKPVWVRFYNEWAQETGAAEGDLASAYSKLEGIAARFALLHHTVSEVMAGRDGRAAIKPESVEAGAILARWFGREARRVYATLTETTAERDVRHLVEWIQKRGGSVTARDLQNSNSRKYPSSEAAKAVLDELVKGGFGEWKQTSTSSEGGRPAWKFFLNPTSDTTDTTSPEEPLPDEEASDTTSDRTSENPQKHGVSGGCVGSVGCRTPENSEQTASEPGGGSVGREGVLSDGDMSEGEL